MSASIRRLYPLIFLAISLAGFATAFHREWVARQESEAVFAAACREARLRELEAEFVAATERNRLQTGCCSSFSDAEAEELFRSLEGSVASVGSATPKASSRDF